MLVLESGHSNRKATNNSELGTLVHSCNQSTCETRIAMGLGITQANPACLKRKPMKTKTEMKKEKTHVSQ